MPFGLQNFDSIILPLIYTSIGYISISMAFLIDERYNEFLKNYGSADKTILSFIIGGFSLLVIRFAPVSIEFSVSNLPLIMAMTGVIAPAMGVGIYLLFMEIQIYRVTSKSLSQVKSILRPVLVALIVFIMEIAGIYAIVRFVDLIKSIELLSFIGGLFDPVLITYMLLILTLYQLKWRVGD
jgi:hypothetical protein